MPFYTLISSQLLSSYSLHFVNLFSFLFVQVLLLTMALSYHMQLFATTTNRLQALIYTVERVQYESTMKYTIWRDGNVQVRRCASPAKYLCQEPQLQSVTLQACTCLTSSCLNFFLCQFPFLYIFAWLSWPRSSHQLCVCDLVSWGLASSPSAVLT